MALNFFKITQGVSLGTQAAPTSLANGDFWFDGTNHNLRQGGATRTLALGGNVTTAAAFTTSGANALTLTTTATTNATLPSGTITLADLGSTQTISGAKTFSANPSIMNATPALVQNNNAAAATDNGAVWQGQIAAGQDSGTVAVTQFQSRITGGTALTTRPIFQWNNFTTVVGNIAASGAWNILGTNTNDSASAGYYGEAITSSQLTFTNYTTSGTPQNITSISLTAGDWDVVILVVYKANGATLGVNAAFNAAISQNTASYTGTSYGLTRLEQERSATSAAFSHGFLAARVTLSATTTVYLVSDATFTAGNPQFTGNITARRAR